MSELYLEGKEANEETAREIIKRLEDHNNYIPESIIVRRDYAHALLNEYREYRETQDKK